MAKTQSLKIPALMIILLFTSCSAISRNLASESPLEISQQTWFGDNEAKLADLIQKAKNKNPNLTGPQWRVAVFDWDNTMMKNDIGDATFFWMLKTNQIMRPVDWRKTSPYLTEAAVQALQSNCARDRRDPLLTNAEGMDASLVSSANLCADTLLSIYQNGLVQGSELPAWKENPNSDTIEPSYAWAVSLMAGHSPQKMSALARSAYLQQAEYSVGSKSHSLVLTIYEPMKEMIALLKQNGFDVYIVSASAQAIVEPLAKLAGVEKDHVVGVRPVVKNNVIQLGFQSCGPFAEGNQAIITYRQGKRCWINQAIFENKNAESMMSEPSPTSFAAGDSDTDVFMVKDALDVHLAINRNKPELMCNAYANQDQKWVINPMFIGPKSQNEKGYACAKFALPDQRDSIYAESSKK